MAEQGDVRSLDQVGSIPSCPSGRRPEQAALPRPSAVRRLRGPPDGASRRRCGRVERLPIGWGPHLLADGPKTRRSWGMVRVAAGRPLSRGTPLMSALGGYCTPLSELLIERLLLL